MQHIERLNRLLISLMSKLVNGQGSLGLGGHIAGITIKRLDSFFLRMRPLLVFLEMVSLCESFVTGSARVGESLDVGLSMAPQVEPEGNICWGD